MKHYEVLSEEIITDRGYYEPPDHGCCWLCVDANSKREALLKAYRSDEMKEWVDEARSDNRNPFAGMTVTEAEKCPHGVYGCCGECEKCYEEMELEIDLSGLLEVAPDDAAETA